MIFLCTCCGRQAPNGMARVDAGYMHFACWEEHHSDPTGDWPPDHVCAEGDTDE